jgi:hypothetical protein
MPPSTRSSSSRTAYEVAAEPIDLPASKAPWMDAVRSAEMDSFGEGPELVRRATEQAIREEMERDQGDVVRQPSKIEPALLTHKRRPYRQHITPFPDIVNHPYPGRGTLESPFIVTWLDVDPENPQTYSQPMKWFILMLVAVSTFAIALASSVFVGGISSLHRQFPNASQEVLTLGLSLFVLGFAIGAYVGPWR